MSAAVMSSNNDPDPIMAMAAPPPNETLMERDRRLRLEAEAKRISDAIDEQIRQESIKRKRTTEVRLLLLGQSSSGKSTLQKQFQLMYAPQTLDLERGSWRPIVYINLIKSMRVMLQTLEHEYDLEIDRESDLLLSSPGPSRSRGNVPYDWGSSTAASSSANVSRPTPPSPPPPLPIGVPIPSSVKGKGKAKADPEPEYDDLASVSESYHESSMRGLPKGSVAMSPISPTSGGNFSSAWAQQIANLRLRLTPLLSMEDALAHKIGMGVEVAPGQEEVFVRTGWQGIRNSQSFGKTPAPPPITTPAVIYSNKTNASSASGFDSTSTTSTEAAVELEQRGEMIRQVANLLTQCRSDVDALRNHPAVKNLIKKRKLRLEESSSFFLKNLERIAVPDYTPTDDDILHARLRTMGVVEHYFEVPLGTGNKAYGWRLFDVGGARGQRPSWVPYFEDATAIIFLAPISAFDQYLEEDQRTNRVDDSLQLFTLICSNPLLKNCHLVLFLNKTDVLKKKLDAGVRVKKYITSYGDRPNDYEHVSNYFLAHFRQVHRKNNVDAKRELYPHLTSVVDTTSTRQIIVNVRDAIFRDHLKESSML